MKKKVLLAIPNLYIGGAEVLVKSILLNLNKEKFTPYLFLLERRGALLEEVERNEIPVLSVKYVIPAKYNPFIVLRIAFLLKSHGFDVIHTHLGICNIIVRAAGILAGCKKIIVHEHGGLPHSRTYRVISFLLQRFTNIFIYISRHDRIFYPNQDKLSSSRIIFVLGNPCVIRMRPYPSRRDRPVKNIGMVGRIEHVKGHIGALKAFAMLKKAGHDFCYYLVGSGDTHLENDIKKFIQENNVDLVMPGAVKDIVSYYEDFDLLVHPSIAEGFGMVIVEAMSFGIPVIATNVGGIKDIITHMENGILVEERSARSIYEAILLLSHNESLRSRISKSGYNSAITKYTLDKYMRRIEEIYLS